MRLDYNKAHSLPRLYEELVAGGITVEGLGDTLGTNDLWVQVPSSTTVATVDSIVAAHSSATPTSWDTANAAAVPTTIGYGDVPTLSTPGRNAPLLHAHGVPSAPYYQNAIDNGDLLRWRRGTSFAAYGSGQDGLFLADNWAWGCVGSGACTITQDTDTPALASAGVELPFSMKVVPSTADASIAAADSYGLVTGISGADLRPCAGGMAHSFWVKNSLTGIYSLAYIDNTIIGTIHTYLAEITVLVADTWEYKTVIIPIFPNVPSVDWNFSMVSRVFDVRFALAVGSNYQGAAGSWISALKYGTASQVNFLGSTSNTLRLAGFNAVPGATPRPILPVAINPILGSSDPATPSTLSLAGTASPGVSPVASPSSHDHGGLPTITQRLTAQGTTGGPTTTAVFASPAAIVDPVVTITTQATGEVLAWWSANVSSSVAGGFVTVQLECDGVLVDIPHSVYCAAVAGVYQVIGFARITGLSAAAHTLQLYWYVSSGTGTANGTGRSILAMEVRK